MGYSSQLASITKLCDATIFFFFFLNFFFNMRIFWTQPSPLKNPKTNPQNQTPGTKEAAGLEGVKHGQLLLKLIDIPPKSGRVVIQDFRSSCGVLCTPNWEHLQLAPTTAAACSLAPQRLPFDKSQGKWSTSAAGTQLIWKYFGPFSPTSAFQISFQHMKYSDVSNWRQH